MCSRKIYPVIRSRCRRKEGLSLRWNNRLFEYRNHPLEFRKLAERECRNFVSYKLKLLTMTQKVWLVTGASKGLGLTLVRNLLDQGHRVAATSRTVDLMVN